MATDEERAPEGADDAEADLRRRVSAAMREAYRGRATQAELAAALGMSQPSVSDLIRRGDPKVSQLAAIEGVAGRSPGYVLRLAGLLGKGEVKGVLGALQEADELDDGVRAVLMAGYAVAAGLDVVDLLRTVGFRSRAVVRGVEAAVEAEEEEVDEV